MKKNVASQIIGIQVHTTADGSDFTGAVTVYVTGDGGAQAIGSVGSGICTHEGNGFHTYVPAQAETNYDHIGFTFTGSGALSAALQVYTQFPQSVDNNTAIAALNDFDPAVDTVASVTLVGTTTTNTDMRGTDSSLLAASAPTNFGDLAIEVTTGTVNADLLSISGGSLAADNLELQYDTTGLTGDSFPATQLQIGNVASTGAATNTPAIGDVVTVGTEVNTFAVTSALDGIYHEISDVAGQMDFYYEFDVGANGTPTSITFTGRLTGANDDLDVFAYNFNTTSWEQIGHIQGSNSTTDAAGNFNLLSGQVGTGANLGKVRVRGFKASGLTSATMFVDQAFLSFATVFQSVGYAAGAVWVDTVNGSAGTTNFVNGTADNPVLTWSDALTIASSVGLKIFHVISGSTVTLTGNSDNYEIVGQAYSLALGGQSIAGAFIKGASISGIGLGGGTVFEDCPVGDVTLEPSVMRRCFLSGTITNSAIGDWFLNHCMSRVAGAGSPVFDFGTAVGNTNLNMRLYSGGIQLEAMGNTGTDLASIEGFGNVAEGTCAGGDVTIRGNFTTNGITNITLSDDARYDVAQVNAEVDTALTDYDAPTNAEMEARTVNAATVAKLESGGLGSTTAQAVTGTLTTTTMTTDLTEATDDHYNGQTVKFTSGVLLGQATVVTDYTGTTKLITMVALTEAPANGDNFIIL